MSTLQGGEGNNLDRAQSCRTSPLSDSVNPGILRSDETEYVPEPVATTELNKAKVTSVDHQRNDVLKSTSPHANGVETKQECVQCSSDTISGKLEGKDASRNASEVNSRATKDFKSSDRLDVVHGGAVWDIFRIEDTPKLIEYLKKHKKEFRHLNNHPVESVSSKMVLSTLMYVHCNMSSMTRIMHVSLGCSSYSRSDSVLE